MRRWLRLTNVRTLSQAFFFAAFFGTALAFGAAAFAVAFGFLAAAEAFLAKLELPAVAAAHHRLMGEVLALLDDAGVAEEDLQTARMTFGENRVYRQGTQYKEGYIASTDVTSIAVVASRAGARNWKYVSPSSSVSASSPRSKPVTRPRAT